MVLYPLTKLFVLIILLTLIHEIAHLAVAKYFGLQIMDYRFSSVSVAWQRLSCAKKVLITLAGALSTLVVSGIFLTLNFKDWSIVSAILGFGNLIPFAGSDGQIVVRLIRGER